MLKEISAEIVDIRKKLGLVKNAQQSSTQPIYVDSDGKVFTAASIVKGFRPSKKYKGYSMSKLVTSPGYGRVKRTGKKKKKAKKK